MALIAAAWVLAVATAVRQAKGLALHYSTEFNPFVVGALITACFAVMLLVSLHRTGKFGALRWATMGALTYPLYLIHERAGIMLFNLAYPELNAHVVFWGTIAVMLAIAYGVHGLVERPFAARLSALVLSRLQTPTNKVAAERTGLPTK